MKLREIDLHCKRNSFGGGGQGGGGYLNILLPLVATLGLCISKLQYCILFNI